MPRYAIPRFESPFASDVIVKRVLRSKEVASNWDFCCRMVSEIIWSNNCDVYVELRQQDQLATQVWEISTNTETLQMGILHQKKNLYRQHQTWKGHNDV